MLLAAGRGRRIGGPKALLRLDGALLVDRALDLLRESGCDPRVVVLGAQADQVRAEARLDEATVVVNRAWGSGVGSSLRAGLATLADTEAGAAMVIPVDMPGLTPEAVWRIAAHATRDSLVCATYRDRADRDGGPGEGRRSYPMLFGRDHWSGIATLATADVGVRPYLLARAAQVQRLPCDDVADGTDVDTPEAARCMGIEIPPHDDDGH